MSLKTKFLAGVFVAPIFATSAIAEVPIKLSIEEPGGPILSDDAKVKKGKIKDKDAGSTDNALMLDDGWMLSFRLAAPDAVALMSTRLSTGGGQNFETLVAADEDDCLDLTDAFPPEYLASGMNRYPNPFDEGCTTGPNEDVILFVNDYSDEPGRRDNNLFSSLCFGDVREGLIDDAFADVGPLVDWRDANKQYIDPTPQDGFDLGREVGVYTGRDTSGTGDHEDCYGYGVDDDLQNLVVMINAGGGRIFNPRARNGAPLPGGQPTYNYEYDNSRIRNAAGLISGVTSELLDNRGATAIIAHMPVRPRMFVPLTMFDLERDLFDFPHPASIDVDRRIEDGPIETVTIDLPNPNSAADLINGLISYIPREYSVEVRTVVVDGRAPAIIEDLNADGEFTADDLVLMGYDLMSNEAVRTIDLVSSAVLRQESDPFECPDGSYQIADLDGDNVVSSCDDGDGTSRSGVRVPR